MRILVAEDERDLNRLICQTLERAGYSVDTCYDGEAALDNLLGAEYDCLLLDIMMPKKDGHAVLRAVRAQGGGGAGHFPDRAGQCAGPDRGAGPWRGRLSGQAV